MDPPENYISFRVTVSHDRVTEITNVFADAEWYIIYPHKGKQGENEHFHVFVAGSTHSSAERYRKRIKALGLSGNQCVSSKLQANGVLCAIQYGSHEGTEPLTKGSSVDKWISDAPKWVPSVGKRKREDVVMLNYVNWMKETVDYKNMHMPMETDPDVVITTMLNSGRYQLTPAVIKGGFPDFLRTVCEESFAAGRVMWTPKTFKSGMWRQPRSY